MNIGITLLTENLGISFEAILALALIVGSLMFYALKFEIGNIFLLLTSGAVFVWMYSSGYNYVYSIILVFISIIFMSFTILQSKPASGGIQ